MDNNVYEYTPAKTVTAKSVMIWGIIAAALSELGLPGLIVGIIGRKKVNTYLAENDYETCAQVKIGSILSKVGIYAGIAFTAFWAIYVIYFIIIVLAAMSGNMY